MKNILVIDNDLNVLEILECVLNDKEYEVSSTSRWQLILKAIQNFSLDLIFLELDLEGTNGKDVCIALKTSPSAVQNIPIILISNTSVTAKVLTMCNAQGFIRKPFNTSAISNIIHQNCIHHNQQI